MHGKYTNHRCDLIRLLFVRLYVYLRPIHFETFPGFWLHFLCCYIL